MTRALVVLAIIVALAPSAAADRATALKYYRAGEKAYAAQSFGDAAASFDKAFAELPLPEIAFSAAQAYRRQYRVEQKPEYVHRAVELYGFYLSKVKKGGRVGDAADSLGEMKLEAERLAREGKSASAPAAAPRTQLAITATLVGIDTETKVREIDDVTGDATIAVRTFLDGQPVAPGKMIDVTPGDHVVRAEADGFKPLEKKQLAIADNQDLVELPLEPLPAMVRITAERGARIIVDDRAIGDAPLRAAVEVPAGRHVVRITRAGRIPIAHEIVVSRGETMALTAALEPTLQRRSVTFVLVAGGIAAATTITTIAFAAHYDSEAADLSAQLELGSQAPSVLDDYLAARANRDDAVTGAWVAGAATLGIAAIAGALYVFDHPSSEGVQVTPFASTSGAGAAVSGRF